MARSANDSPLSQTESVRGSSLADLFKPRKDLLYRHIVILSLVLGLSAAAGEYSQHINQGDLKRFILPALGILIITAALVRVILALLNRLWLLIRQNTAAQKRDLCLIAFAYLSVILGFGTIYLFLENLIGKQIFGFSPNHSHFRILDTVYMSGVTITSVGEVTPVFWFVKFLLVFESLIGIALTGTVLGAFIGSLLSFQQQDQQRRWYGGIRRLYFESLEKYSDAISFIDLELSLKEIKAQTLEIRKGILETIAVLVKAQYAPSPSAIVSANWMRLYVAADASQSYLDLAEEYASPLLKGAGMKTVWGILVLREWNAQPPKMPGFEQLALPVYDPNDVDKVRNQLAGAPSAVTSSDGYYIVSDTELINLKNQDETVRAKMEQYFKTHKAELRSFASVRIDYSS